MIINNGKETIAIRKGTRAIAAVYRGARLVWQAVQHLSAWFRSEGYFRNEPW